MMAPLILESGVNFGPFEAERLFRIEHSDIHKQAGEGIKSVEFIYLTRGNNILFVEAKSSCPNPANKDECAEKYEKNYADITDKFVDSLNMFAATVLGRNGESKSIGGQFKSRTYGKTGIKFVLVITEAKEEWLTGPKAELEHRLLRFRKIWKADVVVLNKEMAVDFGIVKEE